MYQIYQRLPAELVDAIIDASARNMKTLRSLSLVSKNCVPRCRTHIFRSVRFSTDRGEGVLAQRHENFRSILARDPRIQTYIRELSIDDETDPCSWASSVPWIVTNTRFHETLSLVGPRLESFGFTVGYLDWNKLPISLKLPLMSIFTSPALKAITLVGLDNIPRACCVAISSHIQKVEMLRACFSDSVDPDLPMVQAVSPPPCLEWLRLEDVDSESINILLDAWIPAPTQGHDRPLFPCLETLCIGPTDDDEVGPLWELARAGRATLTRFLWEYFGGTRLVEPMISQPLNLGTLKRLQEISYEVTLSSYEDDEDEPLPNPPDYFSGLLDLLQTIEQGNDIQQVFIRFNFLTLSDAVKSLNEDAGWGRLNSALESVCFDHLRGLTLHLDAEAERFDDEDDTSADINLQEKKTELEALIKERIPILARYLESDPEAFMLMVEGEFAE